MGKIVLFEMFQSHAEGIQDNHMQIFDQCDHNGDGKISLTEFISQAVEFMCHENSFNTKIAFDLLDIHMEQTVPTSMVKEAIFDQNTQVDDELLDEFRDHFATITGEMITFDQFNNLFQDLLVKEINK